MVCVTHSPPLSLYLHIPFCRSRCTYCDFNAYAGMDELISRYAQALAAEVRLTPHPARGAGTPPPAPSGTPGSWKRAEPASTGRAGGEGEPGEGGEAVHTVFFGGGTPSLTPLTDMGLIMTAIRESFTLTPDVEITLEANPGTVTQAYLEGLRALGVNRLSLGVQSAHASELNLFDRVHTFDEAVEAVRMARAAGFEDLNLDLIYGIPGQTMGMWQQTFERTVALAPEHLSAYALSLEFGTPMQAWVQRGLLPAPDSDLAADMYEWASDRLVALGFCQYEISNWAALRGEKSEVRACRHNLQYWRNLPYLGLGAGAHGYAAGWRYSIVRSPRGYVERIEAAVGRDGPVGRDVPVEGLYGVGREVPSRSQRSRDLRPERLYAFSPALAEKHAVTRDDEMGETMMLGMRLTREGVRDSTFRERFGTGLAERYEKELGELRDLGLIEWDEAGARLTRRGRLLGNRVFRAFV
jgi:oxygen-independent coproporphyrinogen-3 oxidase